MVADSFPTLGALAFDSRLHGRFPIESTTDGMGWVGGGYHSITTRTHIHAHALATHNRSYLHSVWGDYNCNTTKQLPSAGKVHKDLSSSSISDISLLHVQAQDKHQNIGALPS